MHVVHRVALNRAIIDISIHECAQFILNVIPVSLVFASLKLIVVLLIFRTLNITVRAKGNGTHYRKPLMSARIRCLPYVTTTFIRLSATRWHCFHAAQCGALWAALQLSG